MLRILFCNHQFELIKEIEVHDIYSTGRPSEVRIVYMCQKCGKVKRIKL